MKMNDIETESVTISSRRMPAWMGLDSLRGRYLFGAAQEPVDGIVSPTQCAAILSTPYLHFKGERLFVWKSCASSFLIRDVFVGQRNTGKVNADPIIAEPFSVDADALATLEEAILDGKLLRLSVNKTGADLLGQPWAMPTCPPGIHITFIVENIGISPSRFLGAFSGFTIE